MKSQSGQVSILIAIIFQVVFVFFAMVVNVGLVVNDKINLQNSVDIAAYYGAMKQAEVLNAMGHVNFQMRQLYKLLNWRLWALADAGRNDAIFTYLNSGGAGAINDVPATWHAQGGSVYSNPVVCIYNTYWYEQHLQNHGPENLCSNTSLSIPALPAIKLQAAQALPLFAFLKIFEADSQANANKFGAEFKTAGADNFKMALKMIFSYKYALKSRKIAMHRLQELLVYPRNLPGGASIKANDFMDLSGNSVGDTVLRTLEKNLTAANKEGFSGDITFSSSLRYPQPKPFLVPIDVRIFLKYLDFYKNESGNQVAEPKDFPDPPRNLTADMLDLVQLGKALAAPDGNKSTAATAESFAQMSDAKFETSYNSTVGFEKNPWVLAYVHLNVTTNTKMLFSPSGNGGRIKLSADSYAMPFGGHIGPWYYDTWNSGDAQSTAVGNNLVDSLLPNRIGFAGESDTVPDLTPNYARFPGDSLGMRSEAARTLGLASAYTATNDLPHFHDDDYANLIADDANQDPLVHRKANVNGQSVIRDAEYTAVAPNLFDALYYPINPDFHGFMLRNLPDGGNYFFTRICPTCYDLGSVKDKNGQFTTIESVNIQIQKTLQKMNGKAFWLIPNSEYLFNSWTQESADTYDIPQPKSIGVSEAAGGRIGYSVKIVSKHYLTSPIALGGGANPAPGNILNPPVDPDAAP